MDLHIWLPKRTDKNNYQYIFSDNKYITRARKEQEISYFCYSFQNSHRTAQANSRRSLRSIQYLTQPLFTLYNTYRVLFQSFRTLIVLLISFKL